MSAGWPYPALHPARARSADCECRFGACATADHRATLRDERAVLISRVMLWDMETCLYCDAPMLEQSPEHVFPRSIGGDGLVVGVHPACNRRANALIDNPLVRCGHVRAARAAVGIVSHRTGSPYEEQLAGETMLMVRPPEGADSDLSDQERLSELFRSSEPYGVPGTKVQVSRRRDELRTRMLPNPIRSDDGVFVYTTDDDRGGVSEHVDPYTVLVLVEARRACSHADDTWRRFTAKVGIATIHLLGRSDVVLDDGLPARDVMSAAGFRDLGAALREMAFGAGASGGDTRSEPFATGKDDRPRPVHLAGLADHGGAAVVAVRLFDWLNYRVIIPGVQVRRPVQISIDLAVADDRPR